MKKSHTKYSISFLLFAILCCVTIRMSAQSKQDTAITKDCCLMKNGKMMHMKAGKMELMDKEMTMKNGTKCMANGECVTQQGERLIMKEGECMDLYGNITTCGAMLDNGKPGVKPKENSKTTILYTCPKHPEIEDDQPGICPKCGTELIEKK